MGFELREHTADIAVAATGDSLEDVFGAVADGFAAASSEDIPEDGGERFGISVAAESRDALLFDYLDDLVYQRDVRLELPVEHRVERIDEPTTADGQHNPDDSSPSSARATTATDGSSGTGVDAWSLEATARGVPLADVTAREIKAVTYSEMRLERVDDGWEAYVVFDV